MAKVGIVMGSDSDMPVMAQAADFLEKIGIEFEMTVISAHREPDVFFEYAKSAEEKGYKVMIAGAGKAAHLPGMCAALFPMPVIGVPMKTSDLGGCGFTLFHRSDAVRYPGCHGCHQWRKECRNSGCQDSGCFRSGASSEAEGLFGRDEE